jgi:hypothetical protein
MLGQYSPPALQQYNWSPPVPAQKTDNYSYPTPQYDDEQRQVQIEPQTMQYQLKAQGYQQQQQKKKKRGSLGPFAEESSQQAALAGAQEKGEYSSKDSGGCGVGAQGALNPVPGYAGCPEGKQQQQQDLDGREDPEDISSLLPQVVDVNSGQVLKVTSGEFQDILTVMQALAGTWIASSELVRRICLHLHIYIHRLHPSKRTLHPGVAANFMVAKQYDKEVSEAVECTNPAVECIVLALHMRYTTKDVLCRIITYLP